MRSPATPRCSIEARQIATKRMVDAAEALGADAVVGLRYASCLRDAGGGGGHCLRNGCEVQVMRVTFLDHSGFLVELPGLHAAL